MSTLKAINLQHPSSANNNIVLDSAGNANVANNLVVTGAMTVQGRAVSPLGMKNRIINGDFKIDQRFNGAANNNMAGVNGYVVDRWNYFGTGANKLRFQQNNTNGPGSAVTQVATGFPNYFGANVVSANTVSSTDAWELVHNIEGVNVSDLGWGTANAQPVTLSFWCYSSIAGTHGGTIINGNQNRTYPFTFAVSAANTWQFQSITIPGDTTGSWFTNNSIGITIIYNLGIGSSFNGTNNTWNAGNKHSSNIVQPVSAANGAFYLTGVQLEEGSVATPFEFRPYGQELTLCQRYFEMSYDIGTSLGAATTNGLSIGWVYSSGAQVAGVTIPFKVTKRAGPTINYWDGAGNASRTSALNTTWTNNINPAGSVGITGVGYSAFINALTNTGYNTTAIHWTASAEL